MSTTTVPGIHQALQKFFGYSAFRHDQEKIITRTLSGDSSLVIMPTGGGKSLCYQLPATLLEGLTVVVSPLIALMQDQVDSLSANGIKAYALNSTCDTQTESLIYTEVEGQRVKLLYVSPERAVSSQFLGFIKNIRLSQIAIDEAHCVSIWGNDFRPEYTQITKLTSLFPKVPVVALTATADAATQEDIRKQLNLLGAETFVSSFERKNLHLTALPAQKRIQVILQFLQDHQGEAGIIYCLSRKSTEEIAEKLRQNGYKAEHYHAEVSNQQRGVVQLAFQRDNIQIICATIAFGMGIDKSNIRWVIHYNMPKNLESYYQEIGRAGRDGLPASTLLFHTYRDYTVLRQFIENSDASDSFKTVQYAKLERMWQFCQTTSCRTNVVLNYFGEHRNTTCGHCDHCENPPERFDGTVIAQKALSACSRTREQVTMSLLANVLRGSSMREILEGGFHHIKTYGAGKDISYQDWMQYLTQLVDLGLLNVDFTDQSRLKLTPLSKLVLFDGNRVQLTKPVNYAEKQKATPIPSKVSFTSGLLEDLKELRKSLAQAQGVPAYVIFSDASLEDMAAKKPLTMEAFGHVSGVGEHKLQTYGEKFLTVIRKQIAETDLKGVKGKTYLQTLELFKKGLKPEEIALKRDMNETTVYSHLAKLYEEGEDIPIFDFVDAQTISAVEEARNMVPSSEGLKGIFHHFDGRISYHEIRFCLAHLSRQK